MPETFSEVIVVEGNRDAAKIRAVFPRADVLTTQGAALDEETLKRLTALNASRGLILMLDPDFPGDKIRRRINEAAGPTKHVFLPKHACIDAQKGKVGIEHANDATVREALLEHVYHTVQGETVSVNDMNKLGLSGTSGAAMRRKIVAEAFNLGIANAKTMRKRLNMFAIETLAIKAVLSS